MYTLVTCKHFDRELKKISKKMPKPTFKDLGSHLKSLHENPHSGEQLSGNLRDFWKYKFGKRPEYRIIYALYERESVLNNLVEFEDISEEIIDAEEFEGIIELCFIKTREECSRLYTQKKKYFDSFTREIEVGE